MAVVGAGTMGGGIAMSFADAGMPVRILDASKEVLERGLQRIRDNYAVSVKRGSLTQEEMDERVALITPVETYAEIGDCDAVIEAVFEQMPVKKEVFKQLDAVMKPEALLLTNTSALNIDEIAAVTKRPEMVAGTHYFVPANVMKLFEVVNASKTSPTVLAAAMKLGRDINKVSAYAGNCDGFAANRSRIPFAIEQNLMIEEGALPEQVDKVMVEFGYPVGPFAVADMSGLDIGYTTRKRRKATRSQLSHLYRPDRLVEVGRKVSDAGRLVRLCARRPHTASVSDRSEIIRESPRSSATSRARSATRDPPSPAVRINQRGSARSSRRQGDPRQRSRRVMWLHGFGFPRWRGGLMFWGDTIGAREIYNRIAAWHQQHGKRWQPSNLLREVAESGGKLSEVKSKAFK